MQQSDRWGLKRAKPGRVALATTGVARILATPFGANLYRAAAVGADKGEAA